MFTCIGRRIELMDAFRRAARSLRVDLRLHGTDVNWTAPGMHKIEDPHIVPPISDPGHVDALLSLVRKKQIDVIFPLIDSDLAALAEAAPRFEKIGCRVVISSPDVVRICRDKLATFTLLRDAGIDTPETAKWRDVLARKTHRFPYFLKPRSGSAGKGAYVVRNMEQLQLFGKLVRQPIVQEFVPGDEYTIDVYCGLDGVPTCAVPRKRMEVRTGEVSKGIIVKDPGVIDVGLRVARALRNCKGVITVQCIMSGDGRLRVIEINPRFGGGVPLAIHAGADFPKWLMAELIGRELRYDPMAYGDAIMMLRYDQSVFRHADDE